MERIQKDGAGEEYRHVQHDGGEAGSAVPRCARSASVLSRWSLSVLPARELFDYCVGQEHPANRRLSHWFPTRPGTDKTAEDVADILRA